MPAHAMGVRWPGSATACASRDQSKLCGRASGWGHSEFRIRSAAMIRCLVLGTVLLLALPGVARAELLASSVDDGDPPVATLDFALLGPKTPLRVKVRSSPVYALDLVINLICFRGGVERSRKSRIPPQRGPLNRRVGFPIHNPETCLVSVRARFDGHLDGDESWISLKAYGRADLAPPLPRD